MSAGLQGLVRSSGGYELVFGAALFAAMGFGIDYLLGTMPLFLTIFAVAGFLLAAYSVYRQYSDRMAVENKSRSDLAGYER